MSVPQLFRLRVPPEQDGERLDRFLAGHGELGLSRTQLQRLIRRGDVTVDGTAGQASDQVHTGQEVLVFVPAQQSAVLLPEPLPIDIVYEDDDLLVINKPRGLVVHPAPGHEMGTLVNALLAYSDQLSLVAGKDRPGIVHRLDKDTTGLMLVAKTDAAHRTLSAELKRRLIERRYLAIVYGVPSVEHAVIDAPIGRHPVDRKRMAVVADGRTAWTEYWLRESFAGVASLLECKLYTGRTHQIRVHLTHIGHPVVADTMYGPKHPPAAAWNQLTGQGLHAARLTFTHPRTRERLSFDCPPPDDFEQALAALRDQYGSRLLEVNPDDAAQESDS